MAVLYIRAMAAVEDHQYPRIASTQAAGLLGTVKHRVSRRLSSAAPNKKEGMTAVWFIAVARIEPLLPNHWKKQYWQQQLGVVCVIRWTAFNTMDRCTPTVTQKRKRYESQHNEQRGASEGEHQMGCCGARDMMLGEN